MLDSVKRALRTFLQAFIGFLVGGGVLSQVQTNPEVLTDVSIIGTIGLSAAAAGLTAVVSLVQNTLEDKGVIGQIIPK